MIRTWNKKRGQSTLEYAVLIIVIIAALIAIQTYIKRGVQGRLKSAADDIGDQYSPNNSNTIIAEKRVSRERQLFGLAVNSDGGLDQAIGLQTTEMLKPEVTNRIEKSVIVNSQAEDWGG
jgi:Flp pilus assembly pilin Flp